MLTLISRKDGGWSYNQRLPVQSSVPLPLYLDSNLEWTITPSLQLKGVDLLNNQTEQYHQKF